MNVHDRLARQCGALYLVFMLVSIYGEFLHPTVIAAGDPAATARNLAAGELVFRAGILVGMLTLFIFLFLAVRLYRLFEPVDRGLAVLLLVLVAVGVAVDFANMFPKFTALTYGTGADILAVIPREQREAIALAAFRIRGGSALVPMAFWGVWLFPFGLLVMRSGWFPRVLGILLMVAGVGYCLASMGGILWPAQRTAIFNYLMPLYLGEAPIIFWMAFRGARAPQTPVPTL